MSDPQRTARKLLRTGVTVSVVAAVVAFVYVLQPWRTCPDDDDVPAGCPALPQDAAVLTVALVVLLVSVVATVVGYGIWSNRRRP